MDIIHLKYFIQVARHKSFSKAAAASHVSQSVVSKLVKDLETELGVTLLDRNGKQVTLTGAGAIFLAEADQVVTRFSNLRVHLGNKAKLPKGTVRIGLPLMSQAVTFAQLLGEIRKKYPQIETELYEYGSKKIERAIYDGLLDLGIICCQPGNQKIYNSFCFSHDPLHVVLHPSHPLAKSRGIRLSQLMKESFIISNSDFSLHDEIMKNCRRAGFTPKVVLETSQRELMIQTVAVNLGIALVPRNLCQGLSKQLVKTVPLIEPEILQSMQVIWKKGRPLSYPAQLCLEFAQEYLTAVHNPSAQNEKINPP